MPCEKCGTDRIITQQRVLCPRCDRLVTVDTQKTIENRRQRVKDINSQLVTEIESTDYNQTFGSAIVNRELAAKAALYLQAKRMYAVNEWLAYTLLLRNLRYSKKNGLANFPKILNLSRELVRLHNEIYSLGQEFAVVIESAEEENLEWTENEPLSFVPEEVYQDSDYKMTLDNLSDTGINVESVFLQEGLMAPIWTLLVSEDITRILKRCYHSRILPFIRNTSQASKFVEISFQISSQGLIHNEKYGVEEPYRGIMLIYEEDLKKIERNLCDKFHSDDVKWYFENLVRDANADMFDLSCSIIVRDEQTHVISLPLYSLLMLGYATIKWMRESDLGRALNLKGEIVEGYFYRFVNAYDLSLKHPATGEPLIRVKHPDLPVEIADVMGHNDRNVLVLECKFWNVPLLLDLEKQLGKFEEKVKYIKSNLQKFSLDKELEVIPIFYTPYAPYPKWHGVLIVPTAVTLGMELAKIFGIKKFELVDEIPGLENLFELIDGPLPFPVDASTLLDSLPLNTYRIHDGVVLKYDETEITVFIDLPVSLEGFFTYLDITAKTFRKLKQDVSPGDILRMITINLNGTWTITQLLSFRKIMDKSEWESNPEKAIAYNRMISLFEYVKKKRADAS